MMTKTTLRPTLAFSTVTLTLTLAFAAPLAVGCDSDKKAEVKTADAKGKKADEKKADTKGDGKKADEKKEKTEEEKKKERIERYAKRIAELEEANKKELERWTDEMKAGAKALVESVDPKKADAAIEAVLASPHRTPDNAKRDQYRHPKETLAFFGLKPDMTVLEVGPGAGWYTEVLAPLLAKNGKLKITDGDPNGPADSYGTYSAKRMGIFLSRNDDIYGKIERVVQPDKGMALGEDASVDFVLLSRAMHNWHRGGNLEKYVKEVHRVLKPGGTLAVIQHRAKPDAKPEESAKKGYLPEPWLTDVVSKIGFELVEKSEINANAKDTTDWPEGVWTLPPSLALEDKDKEKYLGIGESDRMTLRFRKK